jgi:hypothetical protein
MAQTKTRASNKKSSRKPAARKRSSPTKSKSKSSNARRTVEHTAKDAGKTVERTAKNAGHSVGKAASKAKLPLVAGGAALVGAAGGLAMGAKQTRPRRRPQIKVTSRDMAHVAKEVGSFGAQMGRLASELQSVRQESNGSGKHRSPVEVVLEGLTARRSRS